MWKALTIDSRQAAVPVQAAWQLPSPDERKLSESASTLMVALVEGLQNQHAYDKAERAAIAAEAAASTIIMDETASDSEKQLIATAAIEREAANAAKAKPRLWLKKAFKRVSCRDAQAALGTAIYQHEAMLRANGEAAHAPLDLVGLVAYHASELPRKWQRVMRHAIVVRVLLSSHWQKLRGRAVLHIMMRRGPQGRIDTISTATLHVQPQDVVVGVLQQVGSVLSFRAYQGHQTASGYTFGYEEDDGFSFHKDAWLEPGAMGGKNAQQFSKPFRSMDVGSDHFELGLTMCEALLSKVEYEEASAQLGICARQIKAKPAPSISEMLSFLKEDDADAEHELGINREEVLALVAYRDKCAQYHIEVGAQRWHLPIPWLRFGQSHVGCREAGLQLEDLPDGSLGYPAAIAGHGSDIALPTGGSLPYRENLGHILDFSRMDSVAREEQEFWQLLPQVTVIGGRKAATQNCCYITPGDWRDGGDIRLCVSYDDLPEEKQWTRDQRTQSRRHDTREKTSASS